MPSPGSRCTLSFKSAWPLALKGDEHGLVTSKAAKRSGARCRPAVVSTHPSPSRNKISSKFARRILGKDAYNLACFSSGGGTLGQVAAIVTWRGTALLWTLYFVLDDLLDFDVTLGNHSWASLMTIGKKLPGPWSEAVARNQADLKASQCSGEDHQPSTTLEGDPGRRLIHNPFSSKRLPERFDYTDTRIVPKAQGSICPSLTTSVDALNDTSPGHFDSTGRIEGELGAAYDMYNVSEDEWVWDSERGQYHLRGRSETDFGYWYPDNFA